MSLIEPGLVLICRPVFTGDVRNLLTSTDEKPATETVSEAGAQAATA